MSHENEYHSPIDGKFQVGKMGSRIYIDFTPDAYEIMFKLGRFTGAYKTAIDFIRNISPDSPVKVEYEGKLHPVLIGDNVLLAYTVSMEVTS